MMGSTTTDRRAADSLRCPDSAQDATGARTYVFVLKDGTEERIEGADAEDALAKFCCARLISRYWALEKIEDIFRQDTPPTGTATRGGEDDREKLAAHAAGCGTAAASSPSQSGELSSGGTAQK